ncbi:hypothetical protein [Mesorhizobium sp. M0522]|uniref:hypothetical protein n=1 Tax=Mesorhizobium sp. M0522 TaxID=2956958 RepID=UPI00333C1F6C
MSTTGSKVLIGTLVAGLAHPMAISRAEALAFSPDDRQATFLSRVETLQKAFEQMLPGETGTDVSQFRDLPWSDFQKWAQCGTDVVC